MELTFNTYDQLKNIEPGFYNISHEEYLALPGVNNSGLRLRQKYHGHGHKQLGSTDAMAFGTLFHELVLEPHVFSSKYHIMHNSDKRTKAYNAELLEVPHDKKPIDKKTYAKLLIMQSVVNESEVGTTLLDTPYKEITALFDYNGLHCKIKIDALKIKGSAAVAVDLKTISSLDEFSVRRHCRDFGYDGQAAFYLTGLKTLLPDLDCRFANLFCESVTDSKSVIGCLAASFPSNVIQMAEDKNDAILKSWNEKEHVIDLDIYGGF